MKNIYAITTALLLILVAASASRAAVPYFERRSETGQQSDTAALRAGILAGRTADQLIETARKYLGKPYKYGASGPDAFDCAGFAMFIYKQFGYELSRSSRTQVNDGRAVYGDITAMQKGDILVFSGSHAGKTPGHIGIFMELTPDGKDAVFIHSARGGVQITKLSEPYYSSRFLGVRRILPDFIPALDESATAEYQFDTDGDLYVRADTLSLGSNDLRVVMFDNGKWVFIDRDGRISTPPAGPAIVLYPGGDWRSVPLAGRTIPGTPDEDRASFKTVAPPSASGQDDRNQDRSDREPSSAAASAAGTDTSEYVYHTIKSGDTLGKLAAKYHTTVKALCSMNGVTERTVLHIGKKLRVR